MREIALDTETTGLNPKAGHRIVEIGCVEMFNHIATGEVFHAYMNPQRDMPEEAFRVHGLSEAFLRKHPLFSEVSEDFLSFIGEAPLVIHNAGFDMGFLNAELERIDRPGLDMARAVDTVRLARQKYPGAQASLDALCKRFAIDNSARDLHGALLDARLLADVYLELMGGRQTGLGLTSNVENPSTSRRSVQTSQHRQARVFVPSTEEQAAHQAFIAALEDSVWEH